MSGGYLPGALAGDDTQVFMQKSQQQQHQQQQQQQQQEQQSQQQQRLQQQRPQAQSEAKPGWNTLKTAAGVPDPNLILTLTLTSVRLTQWGTLTR